MHLFFDTETTSKIIKGQPPESSLQPRIVQLGALLVDDNGTELACLDVIVKPENFIIPKEASDIHGITTEMALKTGIPLLSALACFNGLVNISDLLIGHNIEYDMFVIEGEYVRNNRDFSKVKAKQQFCTMQETTNLCKIPGNYGKFKWPKLCEVYSFIFKKDFEKAHSAIADVRACKDIYFWLKQNVRTK